MNLYATANLEIIDPNLTPANAPKFRELQSALNDAMEDAVLAVLDRYGIVNDGVHTVILDEIYTDDGEAESDNED